jgi:predicted membrane metal-binding protein
MHNETTQRELTCRKSPLTTLTRAYFFLGALLVIAFLVAVGPYLAKQTINIWMAFGAGLALIAYGQTNIRWPWLSIALTGLGTVWIGALVFTIFGVAEL